MTGAIAPPVRAESGGNRKALVAKIVFGVLLGIVLYELPLVSDKTTTIRLTTVLAFATAALGLNLLTGFNGQISVGHAAFMGIGGYTTAILAFRYEATFATTLVLGAVIAFVVGLIVGLPALRIKGVYLALVTLALATLFPQIAVKFGSITGGTQGITLEEIDDPVEGVHQQLTAPQWTKDLLSLRDNQYRYYVALVITIVAFLLVRNLVKSRAGRALVAIRDNETPAEVLGVHVGAYKVITFGIAAMLGSIGGSLYVMTYDHVDARTFGVDLSIKMLVAVVVGGVATYAGPAVGAFALVYVEELFKTGPLHDYPLASPVLFGAALVVMMMIAPGGVVGLVKQSWGTIRRRVGPSASPSPVAPADTG